MPIDDGFASFMEGQGSRALVHRLRQGDRVQGAVTHIASDSVFVDLKGRADGRVPRAELCDARGTLHVKVGDTLEATVLDPDAEGGPLLAVTMGRDQRLDLASLELALQTGTPVDATVKRAVKAGLEVELGGARAFCPASQIERGYVSDLAAYVGQTLRVIVTEIKEAGRSVVVSRRRALELEREQAAKRVMGQLAVGQDVSGTVASVQPYGAFIDLGGVEGLVHISEISHTRVDHVQDVLAPGEAVVVRVLAIEDGDKGKRIRLSLKALQQAESQPGAGTDEILTGKVTRMLPHGLIVDTSMGQGLLPRRELGLPPGADHRRAFALEQPLEVVLLDGREGSYRFSHARVDEVRARKDFAEYREGQAERAAAGTGSLGALLGAVDRNKLPPGQSATPSAPAPARPDVKPEAPPQRAAQADTEHAGPVRGKRRIVTSGRSSGN